MKKGDRIRLLEMPDDPSPMPAGAIGVITNIVDITAVSGGRPTKQLWVEWEGTNVKRTLSLCVPPDRVEVVRR